jgi:ppGpp synthetase/RelA/SpoT-type nucleotidyltranferase
MNLEEIKKDYEIYKPYYKELQKEVFDFLQDLKKERESTIDILDVSPRLYDDIKKLDSILRNFIEKPEKYKGVEFLTEIKDIAGNRITCHCQTDRDVLFDILGGKLRQKYIDVTEDKKDGSYRAYHFNLAKNFEVNGETKKLYCEIQLRTVLGNAWAIQDSKYLYKNKRSEGEPKILSRAVSDILYGCESLWDLVKMKSKEEKRGIEKILKIKDITTERVGAVKEEVEKKLSKKNLDDWFDKHQSKSFKNFRNLGIIVFMEVKMHLPNLTLSISKNNLKDAARKSQIRTFGWPIAVYSDMKEHSPKPDIDGIVAEIEIKNDLSYDYWSIKHDGSFYLLKSLFEDKRKPNYLFFDTRIIRITEVLMYALNLYSNLSIKEDEPISIMIKHGGLKDRIMGATSNRLIAWEYKSIEDEISTEIVMSIREIKKNITDQVVKYTTPFFELFDFFSVERKIIDDIVTNYIHGKVT